MSVLHFSIIHQRARNLQHYRPTTIDYGTLDVYRLAQKENWMDRYCDSQTTIDYGTLDVYRLAQKENWMDRYCDSQTWYYFLACKLIKCQHFKNYFTAVLGNKFVIRSTLKITTHHKCLTTLPRTTLGTILTNGTFSAPS